MAFESRVAVVKKALREVPLDRPFYYGWCPVVGAGVAAGTGGIVAPEAGAIGLADEIAC